MRPNSQETADLVTFAEEILNGKLQFLCSASTLVTKDSIQNFFKTPLGVSF